MSAKLSIALNGDQIAFASRTNLDDRVNFAFTTEQVHFNMSFFKGGIQWGAYLRDAIQRGNQPVEPHKEITFGLMLGGTYPTVTSNLRLLEVLLQQARDATRLGAVSGGVVLCWQPDADTPGPEYYIDVLGGSLEKYDRSGKAQANSFTYGVNVTLAVRPFYRQAAQTIATSGTITDCVATYRIADTGGDADGLLKLTVTDQSINSKIINRIRVGRRSLHPLASGDFTPLLTPTATGAGSTFTDATARGGSTPRLAATSSAWQTFASASQPVTGAAQGGEVAIWARLRDNAPYVDPTDSTTAPTVTPSTAAGTLTPDTYLVRVAAVDSAGNESAAGAAQAATLANATGGIYDTFSSGGLSTWDNSGYTQFYRNGTTQTAGAGQLVATPDAAYEGVYGCRGLVITDVSPASALDVYRTVLQKGAQGVTWNTTGTSTVYGRFRINTVLLPSTAAAGFICFFSAAQGNTSGTVAGYTIDYTVGGSNTASSSVVAGLRFIGDDLWQFCAPYGGASAGASWLPLPGYYVHLTQGQWYSFACSMTYTYGGSAGFAALTLNFFTLNGVLISGAQNRTVNNAGGAFPSSGAGLTPTVGTVFYSPSTATYDLNDELSIDFDDVGALTGSTLGQLAISWTAVGNAASYNLYYTNTTVTTSGEWARVVLGNVTSTTLSTPVATQALLPQIRNTSTIAPAVVRAAILPPNAAGVGPIYTRGGSPILAQSRWEGCVQIGVATLPALPLQEGASSVAAWVIQLQAQAGGPNSTTIDCDSLFMTPVDEDGFVGEVPGAALPSLGVWTIFINRLDRQGCSIAPAAGGTATSYASIAGQMHAGQGDTLLCLMLEISDGNGHYLTDLANTKVTIGAQVVPRFELA